MGGAPTATEPRDVPLTWGDDTLTEDRPAEWRQILGEVRDRVRTTYVGPERDTLDLDGLVDHYAVFLPNLRSRGQLNGLIRDMLGHLDLVSHLGVGGGDEWPRRGERPGADRSAPAGLLGADLVADGGRYRFDRVYRANRYTALYPQVTAPLDRPGTNVRFNGGGTTADELVEILGRSHLYGYDFRHGDDLRVPSLEAPQERVLIANQHDASAAETFALMWKRAELGPVVGTYTMGGLVGSALDQPSLVDGGRILIPNRAPRAPGLPTSRLEGVGIAPDVSVDWTVEDRRSGPDPQLEAAIRSVPNRLS